MLEGNFPQHFQNLHHHDAGSTLFANDAVATFSKYLGSEEKPVGRLNKWAVEQQKRLEGDETILVVIRPLKSKSKPYLNRFVLISGFLPIGFGWRSQRRSDEHPEPVLDCEIREEDSKRYEECIEFLEGQLGATASLKQEIKKLTNEVESLRKHMDEVVESMKNTQPPERYDEAKGKDYDDSEDYEDKDTGLP
uniref:AlNc14C161G7772 protein n=1 Tax=Albugo laibachii Nc14 TaxID=890382 RepID=F0WMT6_9STRA|nr:AlNc14C161G7772 [Albugo laibachii Nc14]|eukprot:CCA22621.1 AlNc14C161G7772 [Albugo laibachii Nc14]